MIEPRAMARGGDGDGDPDTVTDHAKAPEPLAATGARQEALQAPLATLYGYICRISGRRQIWLTLLSSVVFPLVAVPLELQRRIVNHAIGALDLRLLWRLCSMYIGVVLIQGVLKYLLNVYREVVSERAIRTPDPRGVPLAGSPSPALSLTASPRRPRMARRRGAIARPTGCGIRNWPPQSTSEGIDEERGAVFVYGHRISGLPGNRPRYSQVLSVINIPSTRSSNTVGAPRPVGNVNRF